MRSFIKLFITQIKLFAREPIALFFTIIFPLLLLLLFGAAFGNDINPQYSGQYGYIDAEVPGLTAIIIGTISLMSIPIATATAREQKILRRYKATPLRPTTYLAVDIAVYFLIGLVGMILLIVTAELAFGLRFGGSWLNVLAGFTLATLAFAAAGYVIASLSPTSRIAQVAGQIIFFPMMFLSGATLPTDIMPEGLRLISSWLPLTHVVNLLQNLWFGAGWQTTPVLVLVAMLLVGTAVSAVTFRWD